MRRDAQKKKNNKENVQFTKNGISSWQLVKLLLLLVCTPRLLGRLFTINRGRWRWGSKGSIGPVGPPGVLVAGLACIVGFQECHYCFDFIGCSFQKFKRLITNCAICHVTNLFKYSRIGLWIQEQLSDWVRLVPRSRTLSNLSKWPSVTSS